MCPFDVCNWLDNSRHKTRVEIWRFHWGWRWKFSKPTQKSYCQKLKIFHYLVTVRYLCCAKINFPLRNFKGDEHFEAKLLLKVRTLRKFSVFLFLSNKKKIKMEKFLLRHAIKEKSYQVIWSIANVLVYCAGVWCDVNNNIIKKNSWFNPSRSRSMLLTGSVRLVLNIWVTRIFCFCFDITKTSLWISIGISSVNISMNPPQHVDCNWYCAASNEIKQKYLHAKL